MRKTRNACIGFCESTFELRFFLFTLLLHELNPDLEAIYNWCVRAREIQTVKEREEEEGGGGTEETVMLGELLDAHSACCSHGPHMLLEQRVCERLDCEVAGGNLTQVSTC